LFVGKAVKGARDLRDGGTYIRDLDLNDVRQVRDDFFGNNHRRAVGNRRMNVIKTIVFVSRNGEK
jgi:hypothetical protein